MRVPTFLKTLSPLIFSQIFLMACTLSNRVEDTKVLCSLKDVNPELAYIRLLTPGLAPLSEQDRASTSAEFIHPGGRTETLALTEAGCLALPQADGQLSIRVSSEQEWVAFEKGLRPAAGAGVRDLVLHERGRIKLEWACPAAGFLGNERLAPRLDLREAEGNLQNLRLQLLVSEKNGEALGSLFTKDFGSEALDLPAGLPLNSLAAGEYTLTLNVEDSFFGDSPKARLVDSQCPLEVKRSCSSDTDVFDAETVSCKPKLCDGTYRVGEFWTANLSNDKGSGLFTCQLQDGNPVKVARDATCEAGYFEARASCIGATQVAAGLNHSCAVLTNGDVSCWGYNVFDTLGPSDTAGTSGQALGPQPPVPLSEAARLVSVSSVSSCAILQSGRVQCWGFLPKSADADGFLQYEVQGTPQFVKRADGSDLHSVSSLVVGGGPDHDTYCAVTEKNEGLCWGKDLFSRRQTLQFGSWLYPQRIFADKSIRQLAVSDREICALDMNGAVFCQGSALGSDLFTWTPETLAEVIPVALPAPARSISSQSIGKCAELVDERLYCWGLKTNRMQNLEWNFAHGVPDIPRMLTTAEESSKFFEKTREVGLNGEISCLLKRDGQPVCQLGPNAYESEYINNVYVNSRPPRWDIKDILKSDGSVLRDLTTMGVGFWHGCGVHISGQVYCWGNNQFGRLGNGTVGGSGTGRFPRSILATLIQAP